MFLARSGAISAVSAVLTVALLGSSAAYAGDDLVTDGDGTVPVSASALSFGTVCRGTAGSKTAAFAIRHSGGGQVFADGATVSLSVLTAPAGVTAGSFGTITLPAGWASSPNGTLSNAATGVVTIDTSTVRSYSGTVTFRATGAKGGGGTLTRDDAVSLTGSVVACDTTPPVLTLPGTVTVEAAGPAGAVATYAASAHDAADGPRPVTCSPLSGTTFALGSTTVTCSASDTAGNTATGTFTVRVVDTTGPALTLPASHTIEATSPAGAVATFSATATDLVDGARDVTCAPASGATFALGATTVSCTASDTRGNASSGTFGITVIDTTDPVLSLPEGVVAEATSAAGAAVTYPASASDTVDESVPLGCDHASGATFPLGTTVVTCTGTDDSGNAATGSFSVHVGDTTDPVVNVPGPLTVEATGPAGAAATYAATAYDAVDGVLAPACVPASGTTFPLGTTTVTCTAADAAGNDDAASFAVTVADTTPPALTVPATIVAEATGPAGAAVTYEVSASDAVDADVATGCDVPPGTFALGTTTVTCTATDDAGNVRTRSFAVTVEDTTKPELTLPGTLVVEATGPAGAAVVYDATAADTVSGPRAVTCTPAAGSVFGLGSTTVSCSAADEAGNVATGEFAVVVRDTVDPVLNVPGGAVEEATAASGALVTYAVSATDAVDTDVAIACAPPSGSRFPLGRTTVTCTATDDAGNDVTRTFDVVVQDTTAPAVGVPADATVEATGPDGAAYEFTATALDAVSPVTPGCTPASGATFALGATLVSCTATDAAGNEGSASFTVTVVDTTPPVLTMPADQLLEATGPGGAVASYEPTAADAVDGAVAVTCTPASGATFALGAHPVGCTATDEAGNAATGSFTVDVVDTTPPALTLPDNVVEEATGPDGNAVTYAATATDVVDGAVPVTCTPASGSTFPVTTTPVACSAADETGNTATGGFTVTVKDETAPAVTVPDNATIEATGPAGAVHTYRASADDVVDGSVPTECAPASGATFALGVTPVLCTASDSRGNTGSGGFTVNVVDTTAPVVTVPADRTIEATGPGGAATSFTASATDAVAGSPAVTCGPASGATFPLGVTTVTCSAADGAGNVGQGSFTVTVVDTTAPAVTVPATITREATGPAGAAVTFAASATDAVAGAPATACNPASGTTFALGSTPVTCTASDAAGNTGSATFTVRVVDTTAPALTVPAGLVVVATTASGAVVTFEPSATDAVSGSVAVVCSPASGATFPVGTTTVACSATDGAGNTAVRSFPVSVRYAFSGFLQPVNDTAHQTGVSQSKFRLGSTVPLKFTLGTLGGGSVQQAGSPAFAKAYRGATCDSATSAEAPPEAPSTTGTTYRWDSTGQQYVYNFSTKGLTAGEWRVWAQTGDGQSHYVDLCLTR